MSTEQLPIRPFVEPNAGLEQHSLWPAEEGSAYRGVYTVNVQIFVEYQSNTSRHQGELFLPARRRGHVDERSYPVERLIVHAIHHGHD